KDEFGKLAIAFNKVIKEFDEMDYGRVVQESLLPIKSPQIDGYDIAYFKISASDLAGDYHDHAFLEDGKLTILLGDVSGHGISASLAMAMAKATFNYAQSLKVKFPEEFMEMLNTMFNKELKPRNKLMTMISMVLSPETGEVIFDNSGQSYPAYFTASSQTSEEIKMPSLPLGGMKKRKKKAISKVMEPGDAFIFYTDGIIEASAANGEMFGYERFFSKFTEQMKKNISSKEAIKNIYDEVENFREPGHHSDDITMIIVRRKS
ncbi:MAG: SpoIIE family protein phosphatase, partial [Candidatus Riflebacteria bacterium]|nr:SpoIIE family protein phosphatase [Candidatus Riflebacteria bacterium]